MVLKTKRLRMICLPDAIRAREFFSENQPLLLIMDSSVQNPAALLEFIKDLRSHKESHFPYVIVTVPDKEKFELEAQLFKAGSDFVMTIPDLLSHLPGLLQMYDRQEMVNRKLRQHQDEMESILATQKEMVCRFLPDTTLTYVNEAYARTFGKKPKELIGKRFIDLLPDHEHEIVLTLLQSFHAALAESEQRERLRISRELHDHIGQMLVLIKIRLEQHLAGNSHCKGFLDLEEIFELLQRTMRDVRIVSRRVVSGFIKADSFKEAISEMLDSYERIDKLQVNFITRYVPKNLTPEAQTNLYRILQESLSNTVKHGKATQVRISMYMRNNQLRISYRDNGVGLDVDSGAIENGFHTIKHRVGLLGGELTINSRPGRYFKFIIVLPATRILNGSIIL